MNVCDLYLTSAPLNCVCFLCVSPTCDWLTFAVSLSAEQLCHSTSDKILHRKQSIANIIGAVAYLSQLFRSIMFTQDGCLLGGRCSLELDWFEIRGALTCSLVLFDPSDVSQHTHEVLWDSMFVPVLPLSLFLSPPYPLSLKRIGDKVIMLHFSARQEPFAVTGLLNVFLLRWGLCAVEPQWTELLRRKKEKCSFWATCSINHLSCGNSVICISPATAGGSAYESRHDWLSWAVHGWTRCKNWLPFHSWAGITIELAMFNRMLNWNLNQNDRKINVLNWTLTNGGISVV